jgi:hypothetical protein
MATDWNNLKKYKKPTPPKPVIQFH